MTNLQITTAQGEMLGKENTSDGGRIYRSFSGIPFAKPPIGNLRFKPPQKPEPWSGVRDATVEGNACRCKDFFQTKPTGDEDCLYLNIYIPESNQEPKPKSLPVMVYIHGGGFVTGSSGTYMHGPEYIMDYDIILVTINYRLGVLGFLNLELEDAPGNVGLMDQVAALRWVQENIAAFGGDPDNVTIFGVSAGGASVHYLMLSDTARGLFHKAIAQSGVAINPWALQRNHMQRAFQLCEALGHPTNDQKDALEFLKQVSVDDLITAKLPPVTEGFSIINFIFVPTIEKRFPTHEPFMSVHPLEKLRSGNFSKVPFMAGCMDAEGKLILMDYDQNEDMFDFFDKNFENLIPLDLELPLGSAGSVRAAEDIRRFYYGNERVSPDNKKIFVDLIGDTWFIRGVDETIRNTVRCSEQPVFYYEFSYTGYSMVSAFMKDHKLKGASHGDDLGYFFTGVFTKLPKEIPGVVRNQKRLLTMWSNFARTGNPTPELTDLIPVKWEPVSEKSLNYLSIGEDLVMKKNPCQNRLEFWEKYKSNAN